MIYPQIVPKQNRGTYFIDMGKAFEALPDDLKTQVSTFRTDQVHRAPGRRGHRTGRHHDSHGRLPVRTAGRRQP
jgi:alpha-ketoglutarate-dependent taurine dioxygenase